MTHKKKGDSKNIFLYMYIYICFLDGPKIKICFTMGFPINAGEFRYVFLRNPGVCIYCLIGFVEVSCRKKKL